MTQRKGEAARAYWRELIAEQAGSGQTVAEFCRTRGVPRTGLFAWRRKLEMERRPGAARAFVEVKLPPAAAVMTIELGNGRRVRVEQGFDGELLRRVLEALER